MLNPRKKAKERDQPPSGPLFLESGWLSFLEQMPKGAMSTGEFAHRSFFAGAAMLWAGFMAFHDEDRFNPEEGRQLADKMLEELNAYLCEHQVRVDWTPQVERP